MTPSSDETVRRRLERFTTVDPASGCWLWTGYCFPNGYAQSSRDGRNGYAHRISYEAQRGPIPSGLDLDHLCRVRRCINPDHLEPVTRRENQRRAAGDRCKRGHLFSAENTMVAKDGRRRCRICTREWQRRSRAWKGHEGQDWESDVTHCPRGHPYDEENTYRRGGTGARRCRTCHRQQERERWRVRQRG